MAFGDNWGASRAEIEAPLPCDQLLPDARVRCHRAITVNAPPEVSFRWLCQLREAPYSYDLLDNFGERSPRELVAGADELEIGQRFMRIFKLVSFDHDQQITLTTGQVAVTYAVTPDDTDSQSTRLLVRVLFDPSNPILAVTAPLLALGDLVMMRKQLLTLKELAERAEANSSPTTPRPDAGPGPRPPSA